MVVLQSGHEAWQCYRIEIVLDTRSEREKIDKVIDEAVASVMTIFHRHENDHTSRNPLICLECVPEASPTYRFIHIKYPSEFEKATDPEGQFSGRH